MTHVPTILEPLKGFRIGDPKGAFPIWDDGGARRYAGRWHVSGSPVIYASEHYSTAMLEKLVHFAGKLPPNQHFIQIDIPAGVSYEVVTSDILPGWHNKNMRVSQKFAAAWLAGGKSAILLVPSVVARLERNFVFNTSHPDFKRIQVGLETPVWWDQRLFT